MNSSLVNYTKLSPNYNTRDRKYQKLQFTIGYDYAAVQKKSK